MKPFLSVEQFKSVFSTGDIICRDNMGRPLLITAIGTTRFLYVSMTANSKEFVSVIRDPIARYRKWDPIRFPDSMYSYIIEAKPNKWSFTARHKIEIDLEEFK